MIKVPKLRAEEYIILRKDLSSDQILNNDDTPYNGSGDNYYIVFDNMAELKQYIYQKGQTNYQYKIYGREGNYIDYICLYEDNIYIKSINSLLLQYGDKRIFENQSFTVGELSSDTYLHLIFKRSDRIQFELRLSSYDIEMQIDRVPEIFTAVIEKSTEKIFRDFITDLFTSTIKVEYIGSHYTNIYFYNKENKQIRRLMYNESLLGLLKIGKKEVHEYAPIFSIN